MRQVLKYPGSKWGIAPKLVSLIPPHHSYAEVFCGSCALLFCKPPSDIELINDLDSDVTNLFRCIQRDPERLARLIMTTPYSREIYEKQFMVPDGAACIDAYQRAVGFLVKCWQGHGFRTNGYKVGWKNDVQGRERMYALWNWYRLPEWVLGIVERLRMVQIENRPALEVIERFGYDNVFQFWDPPYVLSTRRAKQYKYEMEDAEHEVYLQAAVKSKAKIMICGYETDLYNDVLSGWIKVYIKGRAEYGGVRQEIVWMNYEVEKQLSLFE